MINILDFLTGLFTVQHFQGAVISILVAIMSWAVGQLYILIRYRSKYSGTWDVRIYDNDMNVIREYTLIFRHNSKTGNVKGCAKRFNPDTQSKIRLQVTGFLLNNQFIGFTSTNEPLQHPAAFHLILENNYFFKGFYLRRNLKTNDIEKISLDYTKRMNNTKR